MDGRTDSFAVTAGRFYLSLKAPATRLLRPELNKKRSYKKWIEPDKSRILACKEAPHDSRDDVIDIHSRSCSD
jgi:hypothetical protein